ncbi:hypothetical protein SAMN06296386_10280 [Lachnospiraceae bacterium]|nr:hypothetical protein SAMN06296386_10280 [Lachnospiraceae bacterium]
MANVSKIIKKYPWQEDGERWYTFPSFCRRVFGKKLYRVPLDIGCTCPNRDGCIGNRGCIFCDEGGSGDFAIPYDGQKLSVSDLSWNSEKEKGGDTTGRFIAYFQSYTNTYAPTEKLRRIFGSALSDPLFSGISIGTRPDCLGMRGSTGAVLPYPEEPIIPILKELKNAHPDKFIWVELGLQTIHERTAGWIRRGYKSDVFDQAVHELHEAGIPVICHMILGLPGETPEMNLETIRHLNDLKIEGIKLQLLHYLKDTDLGRMWKEQHPDGEESEAAGDAEIPLNALTEKSYVNLVSDCIAALSPQTVIHRLTGDGAPDLLLAPTWSRNKNRVINEIRHTMKEKNLSQGVRTM